MQTLKHLPPQNEASTNDIGCTEARMVNEITMHYRGNKKNPLCVLNKLEECFAFDWGQKVTSLRLVSIAIPSNYDGEKLHCLRNTNKTLSTSE